MKIKIRALMFALLGSPLYFIETTEVVFRTTIKSPVIVFFLATAVSFICISALYIWATRALKGRLFTISPRYIEAAKRFGLVLGIIVGAPLMLWLWYENYDFEYASILPYILEIPGIAQLGFVSMVSLVHASFWCIDSMHRPTHV